MDTDTIRAGDTVAWKNNAGTVSYGLADHLTPEGPVVRWRTRGGHGSAVILWEKIIRHETGRELFDAKASS